MVSYSAQVLADRGFEQPSTFAEVGDPLAAFKATRGLIVRVLDDPATPQKVAGYVHWSISFDLPQHGWDLAMATGQDATMDPEEVELLWGSLTGDPGNWEWQRAKGWYAAPVAVPADGPLQDRVLGLLGRDPHWVPPG